MAFRSAASCVVLVSILYILPGSVAVAQSGSDVVPPTPVLGTITTDQYITVTGGAGGAGSDGGDVLGTVLIDVDLALTNENFTYQLRGGKGGAANGAGAGGSGGDSQPTVTASISGTANIVSISSSGGDGGASTTGTQGSGGKSGPLDVTVDGTFGQIYVFTNGGSVSNSAGNGGNGGEAGDATLDFSGKTGSAYVQSAGGYGGAGGQLGQSGDVLVVVRGEITNDLVTHNAIGTPGTVVVVLEDGAQVGGTISNYQRTHGVLDFSMSVSTQADLDAAILSINAAGAGPNGTVTVAGKSYAFSGFSTLKNNISLLQAQNPGQTITVTFSGGSSTEPGTTFQPGRTRTAVVGAPYCRGRITPLLQPDGRIQLNAHPKGDQRFILGWMEGATFVPAVRGWSVTTSEARGRIKAEIFDKAGELFATCWLGRAAG